MSDQPGDQPVNHVEAAEGVLRAVAVARAADAWLAHPQDVDSYRRFVEVVEEWRTWTQPPMSGQLRDEALLDATVRHPAPLREVAAELSDVLSRRA